MDLIDKSAHEACRDPIVRRAYHEERIRIALVTALEVRRRALRMSLVTLAKKSDTTQPMLSRLFNGDNRSPTLATLVKVADALDLDLAITTKEREPPPNIVGGACNPSAWRQS